MSRTSHLLLVFVIAGVVIGRGEAPAVAGPLGRAWHAARLELRRLLVGKKELAPSYQLLSKRSNTAEWRQQLARLVADDPAKVRQVLGHSNVNGEFAMVTDLHWGYGDPGVGRMHKREDFRQDQAFANKLKRFNTKYRDKNRTLSSGGDWLDLMEAVPANATREQVLQAVRGIIDGHKVAARALFEAVAIDGMRYVYTRGNHDVHVVDPAVREQVMNRIAEVGFNELLRQGRVKPEQKNQLVSAFRDRVAYVGVAATFGKRAELMQTHGDGWDPFNAWEHWALPLAPVAGGGYGIRTTFGWEMVQQLYKYAEQKDELADNHEEKGPTVNVLKEALLSGPKGLWKFRKFLTGAFSKNSEIQYTAEQRKEMEAIGREGMAAWVSATGFGAVQNATRQADSRLSDEEWGERISAVTRNHRPFHEYLSGATFTLNAINLLRPRFKRDLPRMWSKVPVLKINQLHEINTEVRDGLAGVLKSLFENTSVAKVVTGHDHAPEVVNVKALDKELTYMNAGTWTRNKGEWGLNVGRFSTDANGNFSKGRMTDTDALGRSSKTIASFDHKLPDFMTKALPTTHQEVAP